MNTVYYLFIPACPLHSFTTLSLASLFTCFPRLLACLFPLFTCLSASLDYLLAYFPCLPASLDYLLSSFPCLPACLLPLFTCLPASLDYLLALSPTSPLPCLPASARRLLPAPCARCDVTSDQLWPSSAFPQRWLLPRAMWQWRSVWYVVCGISDMWGSG